MKRKNKNLGKIGVIFLIATIALAGAGISYSMWVQELTITGTISSGEVKVGIYDVGTDDPGLNYIDGGDLYPGTSGIGTPDPYQSPGHNTEGKNIASHDSTTEGEYQCKKTIEGISYDFYDHVTETIKNAYPYYKTGTTIWITNCGTIPVKLYDIDFEVTNGNQLILAYLVVNNWQLREYYDDSWHTGDSGTTIQELEESLSGYPNGIPYQLEPCHTLEIDLDFYFEETLPNPGDGDGDGDPDLMPQNQDVEFIISADFAQWNEVPSSEPPQQQITYVYVDDDFDDTTPGWGVDHFDNIQDGVDAVTGSTVYVYSGIYNENVQIYNIPVELIGEDQDTTIINGGGSSAVYVGIDGVSISGFTVTGASGDHSGGIHVSNSDNCEITDVNATGNGIGLYIYGSENSNIHNNICNDNSYYGISLERGVDNTVSDNILQENGRYDLNVYAHNSNDEHCDNTIVNNMGSGNRPIMYYNNQVHLTSADGPFSELILANADDSTINEVTVDGSDTKNNNGIVLLRTDNALVESCTSNENYIGISLSRNNDNNEVYENEVSNNVRGIFVDYYCDDNLIESNIANSNTGYGIYIRYLSTNNEVIDNTVNNNEYQGIYVSSSDYTTVDQNIVEGSRYGIYMESSEHCTITGNYLRSSYYDGIALINTNYHNTIEDNLMDNNNRHGIYMTNTNTDNTFTGNIVEYNGDTGVYIGASSCVNNLFYDNYFDNTNNYYQHTAGSNTWNIVKTSGTNIVGGPYLGGNYWSDYTGTDTDADGLGDTILPYGPGDNHPLLL